MSITPYDLRFVDHKPAPPPVVPKPTAPPVDGHEPILQAAPSAQRSETAVAARPKPALVTNHAALQAPAVIPPADYTVGRFQVSPVATVRQAEPPADYGPKVTLSAWSTRIGPDGEKTRVPTRTMDGP